MRARFKTDRYKSDPTRLHGQGGASRTDDQRERPMPLSGSGVIGGEDPHDPRSTALEPSLSP